MSCPFTIDTVIPCSYRIGPLFVLHGGGPMPLTGDPNHARLTSWLNRAANLLPQKPTSILCISGHWEEKQPTLTAAEQPALLFDYYGFPEEVCPARM